ncbi:MAG TPA: quercetin 2,3-dioxygenase [Bryobacteraceae bacterium]|jgi:quercetin 2,3-dioxygenase|nr:quercetin 2,3-dioxygenase [Bryobacteraceae bacterium]
MATALLSFNGKSMDAKPARLLRFRGGLIKIHADATETAGQFALIEMKGASGGEPPLHVHRNEDELFYVLEGYLKIVRGNEELTLSAGQSAFLPRNVPHTFKIVSGYARFLNYITPGGFEAYFRDMGQLVGEDATPHGPEAQISTAELIRVAGRYSITFMP